MSTPPASARTAAVVTGLINAAVNPLLEVMINRGGFQPLSAVVVNLAITSIVMCALVSVFARRGIGHGVRFGFAAMAAIGAVGALLAGVGVAGIPFWALLTVKAAYCGVLAFMVADYTP